MAGNQTKSESALIKKVGDIGGSRCRIHRLYYTVNLYSFLENGRRKRRNGLIEFNSGRI